MLKRSESNFDGINQSLGAMYLFIYTLSNAVCRSCNDAEAPFYRTDLFYPTHGLHLAHVWDTRGTWESGDEAALADTYTSEVDWGICLQTAAL